MKWRRAVAFALLVSAGFAAGAAAASMAEPVTAFVRRDYQVLLNGEKKHVGDVLIYNNVSYLPLKSLGELLGAEIAFDAATRTIRVTKPSPAAPPAGREPVGQEPSSGQDESYNTTALSSIVGYVMTYGGREYPVVGITDVNYKLYYRLRDLERAGINLKAAKKTLEAITKEMYVSETELNRLLDPDPKMEYIYNRLVIGETEPDRLLALDKYIEEILPHVLQLNDPHGYYHPLPYIYVVERIKDNDYELLVREDMDIKKYTVKMRWNEQTKKWEVSSFSREHLGSLMDYSGYYSF